MGANRNFTINFSSVELTADVFDTFIYKNNPGNI